MNQGPEGELARAVAALRAGELVAFPTETVYGLGADARNPQAVAKIFAAKGRPADHPLIVHLARADSLPAWARELPPAAEKLAAAFWPGPLTMILKRARGVPDAVTGGQDTVGLRVPDHPLALELLAAFAGDNHGGLAAPSANRFGRISPTTAAHVRAELGNAISMVLDGGPCAVGIESTIIDLSRGTPALLRPGAISAAQLAQVLGSEVADAAAAGADRPRVPGSLAAHYAPATPLQQVPGEILVEAAAQAQARGQRVAVLARRATAELSEGLLWQQAPLDLAGYAHELYASLRRLDAAGCDLILVETVPSAWSAVADRLSRAAQGAGGDEET